MNQTVHADDHKRLHYGKGTVVISGDGDPCPRCKRPTEIHEHVEVTKKMRRQPFYYLKWFRCTHVDCQTTLIMPERFKIWNTNARASHMRRNGWSPTKPEKYPARRAGRGDHHPNAAINQSSY